VSSRFPLTPLVLLLCACASTSDPKPHEPAARHAPAWAAPPLDRAVAVRDGRTGQPLGFGQLLDALATADVVFLGETHIDETTHRVELGVYEGIADRRAGKVVLSLEMFERDVQATLDAYLAGDTTEQEFLSASRPWSNYATAYRPLIELAKARGLPVVAANFPRTLRKKVAAGKAGLDELSAAQRKELPRRFLPETPAYWRRVDNAIRGHIGMMPVDRSDPDRLYSTQSLWDNAMGEACADALDAHPKSCVVHVNGGFHTAYWDGTARQLRLRKPDARILTVSIQPVADPGVATPKGAPIADYVVYAETRATDINEGKYSVYVSQQVGYRLHLPAAAKAGRRVPLLIWLPDDGATAEDSMEILRRRLLDSCAIVVVEAPYRETQDDLVEGGRWFWPDSFSTDLATMQTATERIWAFLLRHYPIDPTRVCIAGLGTGATVIGSVSLATDRIAAKAVALSPRRYARVKDIPLPLPELRGDEPWPDKSLRMWLAPEDARWWKAELDDYRGIGFESSMQLITDDPWVVETERENAIRAALGLPLSRPDPDAPRRHIVATGPRARLWARVRAAQIEADEGALVAVVERSPREGGSHEVDVAPRPKDFADGKRLPRCPGPFGGTTVLVLPKSTPQDVADQWLAIAADDPLHARSRFHRLRVATADGRHSLPALLDALAKQGRRNVLVVPVTFCADGATMRALRKSVRRFEDQLTLRWRPGLGGASR